MDFQAMTLDQLNAELEKRDAARIRGEAFNRAECQAMMQRRARLIAEDNAAAHGLTVEQYEAAKAEHAKAPEGTPLHATISKHRRSAVGLQSARAGVASVAGTAKK